MLRACSIVLALLLLMGAAVGASDRSRSVVLERVVDGDTLQLRNGDRVRLIGMNTPEIEHPQGGDECFGEEASRFAKRLLKDGEKLRLVFDVDRRDQYERLLAYVYRARDDLFINAELVKQGYAFVETVPPNVEHADQFRRLAREAREGGSGLWAACPTEDGQPQSLVGGCLPDYVGACVPPPPPDLDCDDVEGPLTVVGDDQHNFDRDGDGQACEPSPF